MKIAVNTRLLIKDKLDGIGYFTLESFKKIVVSHPEVEFIFIFDRTPHQDFLFSKNITAKVIFPPARHAYLYKFWYQFSLKNYLKKIKPDVFIGTDGMIPLHSTVKTLSVIHDLCFEHHPEQLPPVLSNYYRTYFPQFAQQATRIATVSEFTKNDICTTYKIAPEKIDVVYNGSNENFIVIAKEDINKIKLKYTNKEDFFLFVGTLHPRKNLINLFKAFDQFKIQTNSEKKLLIVGRKMWWTKEIEETFQKLIYQKDIIFAGRVDENELHKITASAFAVTYIPFFEGFGIPILEAMKCGVPVITSSLTSMPEVVGNAGLLVDPYSVNDITEALTKISTHPELRESLIQKSLIQADNFSWSKTADLLWASILKTINA